MPKINEKLNILVSCGSYSWGGLEMVALESSLKLLEKGCSVKLLCSESSPLHCKAIDKGIEILPYYTTNSAIPLIILKLRKFLKDSKSDVIHTHHSHDLWMLSPALKFSGSKSKLYLTKHVASGVKKKDMLHNFLYKRLNGVFAISGYIKESIIKTTCVAEDKVHILPNGVELRRFNKDKYNREEILNSLNIPTDKLVIGLAGRITPGKGHIELIDAARILNDKFMNKLFFLIVGSSGKGEEGFEQNIREHARGLNNILFTGHTEEPQKFMAAMDILAFPSHDESFGRVVIEAMAMEVPVAASGFAGVLDIINNGVTGLLFEPRNSDSLASALENLISDETLRSRLSTAGRKLVEEKFTDEIITNKLIEYYTK